MSKDNNQGNLFIKRPKLAIVISLAIMLAGILMLAQLPLEEYPSITPPQVVVSATYAGASSDVIADTIAAPVEAQLNGVENMIYMTSTSQNGSYELRIYFEVGTNPDMAVVNVQNRLQLVTPRLPEEVRRYGMTVQKSTGGPGIMMIAINSPTHTYDSLFVANYASIYIKDELARIKGVSKVQVFGSSDYAMRIWLDAEKMVNLGVSVEEVTSAIQTQNTQVPTGDLGDEPMDIPQMLKLTMRTKGRLKDPKEFEEIIVRAKPDGSQIKIKDIAKVELGAESYAFFSRIGGRDSAVISVTQLPEANAIDLSNRLRKRMKELSKTFPQGIEYNIENDQTDFVRESIDEVISAIGLAVILVGLVTYLFLGSRRAALIPFAAIPVSLIGVFIFMNLLGFSINLLILFALVLAVGLVVDDAIVVLENTQRHIQEGKKPAESAEITMQEVFGAVLATSLVLMAVFVPVSFMTGITGQMFRQFALCIASAIGLSTLVALTLSPALCAMILKSGDEKADFEFIQKFDNWFNKVRDKYLESVKIFIASPKLVLSIYAGIVFLILAMFWIIPKGFLPQEDRGAIFIQIQLPDGSTASRSNMVSNEIEKRVLKIDGVKTTINLVGFAGENTAFIVARLTDWSKRKSKKLSFDTILGKIKKEFENYPSATVAIFSPPAISGLGMFGGFEYQLLDKGDRTPEQLYQEAQKLIAEANKNSAFQMVYTSYTASMPQLMIKLDESRALAQDVNINSIYGALAGYFGRAYVNDFNKYGRVYRVFLQAQSKFRENIADIDKIFVKNSRGDMVSINSVINKEYLVGPYSLTRFNMYPAITINGQARSGVSSGQAMAEMEKLSDRILPKDMGYNWSGSSLQEKQSSGQIGPILLMSLVFIYLFLVGLYESWMLPLAVLLISPVALVGALFFQYIAGYSLDLYSQIGLVMLIGLSTKQAILIIEFAKDAHEAGMSVRDAAIEAARLRFRAVMMTNIAFILGLLPLVFAKGAGAASRHSVGMTVFGGMIAVAFVGTFFVPSFYVMIEELKVLTAKKVKEWKKMIRKLIYLALIIGLSGISAYCSDENIGNKVNENEYPTSESVLPKPSDKADFVIEGSVEKNIDMTLDRCIEIALGNNPQINAAFHDILASDARIKQVWSNYFPQLNWQTGYTRMRQLQLSDALGETLTFNYYLLGQITLQQMLYDFGVTQNQATIKRLDYEAYKTTLGATINDIIYQTKDAYYNLLYAFEKRRVAQDTVNKFEMFYNQAKAFYEIGMNPKVDVTIAEVNLSNSKLQLIQADNEVNLAVARLNNIMGVPFIDKYNVIERLKYAPVDINFQKSIEIARDARPELKLAELKVESAKQTVKLVKKSYFPTLSIEGQYMVGGSTPTSNYGYNLGGYLNFPTVNGMLIKNEIKEAKYLYDKELAKAKNTQNQIYLEIQKAYLTLEEKKNQMPVAMLNVKQAKENYELSFGRYKVGEASPTELKDAQINYQQAQLSYYSAMYQYNSAKAALEKAIGKNLVANPEDVVELDG